MYNFYPNYQRYEVVKVSGEGGAQAFQMAPNSSVLLLDETAPIVWLKTTDGAGYPTLTPYTITPYEPKPPINLDEISERISRLEGIIDAYESNTGKTAKQSKSDKATGNDDKDSKGS